jgi:hypothetical protein
MTRLRARAPRGNRVYGKVPRNRGKNTTLIAAITLQGAIGESMSVEGATDAEAFSKIKALVRKEGARVREALVEAIGRALAAVTPEDAAGWFAHAGYWPQDQPL